jgi:hypothetical protein
LEVQRRHGSLAYPAPFIAVDILCCSSFDSLQSLVKRFSASNMSDDDFEIEYGEEAVTIGNLHSEPLTFQITSMANDGIQTRISFHSLEYLDSTKTLCTADLQILFLLICATNSAAIGDATESGGNQRRDQRAAPVGGQYAAV